MKGKEIKLTKTELRVVEAVCVGYSDKEAASVLCVSPRTIVNHKQNVFHKLGINKVTELAAWYWCQKFNHQFDLAELKKQVISIFLLLSLLPTSLNFDHDVMRARRAKPTKTRIETRINPRYKF